MWFFGLLESIVTLCISQRETQQHVQVEANDVTVNRVDIGRIVDELAIRANVDVVNLCGDRRGDGCETESND